MNRRDVQKVRPGSAETTSVSQEARQLLAIAFWTKKGQPFGCPLEGADLLL
jgi:hypothetical protein